MSIQINNLSNHIEIVVDSEKTIINKIGATVKPVPGENNGISIFVFGESMFVFNKLSDITQPIFTTEAELVDALEAYITQDGQSEIIDLLEEIKDGQSSQITGSVVIKPENTSGPSTVPISGWAVNTSNSVVTADPARRGLIITNNTNKTILLRVGGTVATTSWTYQLSANGYAEIPFQFASLSVTAMYTVAAPAASGVITLTIVKV